MGTYSNAVDHYTVMKAENRTKMGVWGVSSGAHLGQTIAALYPEVYPSSVPGIDKKFDWSALHKFLTLSLHGPGWFPLLAGVFAELEAGTAGPAISGALASALNPAPASLPLLTEDAPFDGILSGVCLDEARHIRSKGEFQTYFKSMTDSAASIDPINKPEDSSFGAVKTKGKIVVLSDVGDPASSIQGAKGVAARFKPSVLVKNLAAGYTSFAAANNCLFGVFYGFFVLSQMPEDGYACGEVFAPAFGVQIMSSF
ncbi:hypothetical protein C8034_v005805 [Colletotrichum sidae]|uniref:Peptidase S33 tripeptidyl aminopeptidase-like C-terminal domain-containing protein n=1 Tax=Colletotrichum sidae TaxID=1347389 RepID=A0A4R8T6T4_9PEZI|nr:hypothetical protein C8034_v005805 [Colletotrichum sidae]